MKERETFSSRIGFILVSAGCAVGLGNVWKFPYICGQYGGAAFILIYLICLAILGYPILVCEFAVGRGSRKSCATSFKVLEPKDSN
jgi:NSS family neurotransmitter:Na+ symporter